MNNPNEITGLGSDIARKFSLKRFIVNYSFYIFLILLVLTFSLVSEKFFTFSNFSNILFQISPYAIVTCGICFVLIGGEFDISVGSSSFLSLAIGATLMEIEGFPIFLSIIIVLVTGILIGAINGLIVTRLKIPGFLVTLSMLIGLKGLGLLFVGNRGYIPVPESFKNFGKSQLGPFFNIFLITIVIMIIVQIVFSRTVYGKRIFAIGDNKKSAERLGIKSENIMLVAFILAGFFAAFSGLIRGAMVGNIHVYLGEGLEFEAITMAVVGGVSLYGGKGRILPGVLLGVFLITIIDNGLSIIAAPGFSYPLFKGAILFVAVTLDSFKNYIEK